MTTQNQTQQADAQRIEPITTHHVTLTDIQHEHYEHGEGISVYAPDGELLFCACEPELKSDHGIKLNDVYQRAPGEVRREDEIIDAKHMLEFLYQSLMLNDGELQLNDEATKGLAEFVRLTRHKLEEE